MQAPYSLTLPASTRESTNREDAPQPESATARSLSAAPRTQPQRPENRPRTAKTPLRTLPGKPGNLCIQSDVLLERVTGIEPALSAWEAEVLPLNYAREAPDTNRYDRHNSFIIAAPPAAVQSMTSRLKGVTSPNPRPVVAAAIFDRLPHPSALLCASRSYPEDLRGLFELPGGKVEEGEDPLRGLVREIDEELGCTLRIAEPVLTPEGKWWPILNGRLMAVWGCTLADPTQTLTPGASHLELRWTPLDEVMDLPWIPADLPIVQAAINQFSSGKFM